MVFSARGMMTCSLQVTVSHGVLMRSWSVLHGVDSPIHRLNDLIQYDESSLKIRQHP